MRDRYVRHVRHVRHVRFAMNAHMQYAARAREDTQERYQAQQKFYS